MDASKREFIRRTVAASFLLAVGGLAIWDLIQAQGGQGGGQQSVSLLQTSTTSGGPPSQSTTGQAAPAGYILVAGTAALSGKTSAYFNHPTGGLSLLLNIGGQWKAFSATCTHAPCTVHFSGSQISCPCHGGTFDPNNGNVIAGPPPTRLPEYGVLVQSNNLYVSKNIVN